MLQMLLHYIMEMMVNISNNRELQGLSYTTENPGVGGSIPPRTTKKPFFIEGLFCYINTN